MSEGAVEDEEEEMGREEKRRIRRRRIQKKEIKKMSKIGLGWTGLDSMTGGYSVPFESHISLLPSLHLVLPLYVIQSLCCLFVLLCMLSIGLILYVRFSRLYIFV